MKQAPEAFALSGAFACGDDAQRHTASRINFTACKVRLLDQRRAWCRTKAASLPVALGPLLHAIGGPSGRAGTFDQCDLASQRSDVGL